MQWDSGASLFRNILPLVADHIGDESEDRRISILANLLSAFASSGADIRGLYGYSEDVDAALRLLGVERQDGSVGVDVDDFTIDLSSDEPPFVCWFEGGPYDRSSFRIWTEFREEPPATIVLAPGKSAPRSTAPETYQLRSRPSYDKEGEVIAEDAKYFHVPPVSDE